MSATGIPIDDGTIGPANNPPVGGLAGEPTGSGAPFGQSPPIAEPVPPPFTPPLPAGSLADFNAARNKAWAHCSDAVDILVAFMTDEGLDISERMNAAAELLQFAAKGLSM